MRRRRYAGCLAGAFILAATLSSGARADNEHDAQRRDNLIALLMVEESTRICSFAIADKTLQQLAAARTALAQALKVDDPQIAKLRADLDQQFAADRAAYCAPNGPWKKVVDQTLADLPAVNR